MRIKILRFITGVAAISWAVSGSMLDSDTYIPHVICLISSLWLVLILWANMPEVENGSRKKL